MKPPAFSYSRADTPAAAAAALREHGEGTKLLAGGQSLMPLMGLRFAVPTHLVDINPLRGAHAYIRAPAGADLEIGGLTRHVELERAGLERPWQAFADAVPLIGHHPIRTRGTFGGSIAHADATAEIPLLTVTFGAELTVVGPDGSRLLAAEDFFTGPFGTRLGPDEILVGVRFPTPPPGAVSAFAEFSERAGDFAIASGCVVAHLDADGICTWARVGLGAVAGRPIRSAAVEEVVVGRPLDAATIAAAGTAAQGESTAGSDHHATAEFRGELAGVVVERALDRVIRRCRTP